MSKVKHFLPSLVSTFSLPLHSLSFLHLITFLRDFSFQSSPQEFFFISSKSRFFLLFLFDLFSCTLIMESLSRKSKIGASVTNSPGIRNQSNSNLYTSSQGGIVEGYHVPSSVLMSQGHQLYPTSGREGAVAAHLHQYEELKVLIPEYGSRKALIYSNGHGNSNHPPSLQQQQLSGQRRNNDVDQISSSLHPGSSFFSFLLSCIYSLSLSLSCIILLS